VLNWLWLALANQRLGKAEEARRWLSKAQGWLDRYGDRMPARGDEQVGQTLTNCVNMIGKQPLGKQRAWLEELQRDVKKLIDSLPADKKDEAPEVAKNLERLVEEATSAKPNRRWYSVSAVGLLEASKYVKDFTGNIAGTLKNLGKAIWPDFLLPEAK
jgi:hypothetical protein